MGSETEKKLYFKIAEEQGECSVPCMRPPPAL